HLNLDHAIPLAGLTAPALDVEAEASGLVAASAGLLGAGEQIAHRGEDAGICGRVGARGASDWALINVHDLVQLLQTNDAVVSRWGERRGTIKTGGGKRIERAVDQRGFAGTGDPSDAGKQPQRNLQVNIA